jgi:hypothetical protein
MSFLLDRVSFEKGETFDTLYVFSFRHASFFLQKFLSRVCDYISRDSFDQIVATVVLSYCKIFSNITEGQVAGANNPVLCDAVTKYTATD